MKSFNRIATSIALATLCTVSMAAAPLTAMAEGLQPTKIPSAATEKQASPLTDVLQPPASNRSLGKELPVPDAINQGKALKDSLTTGQQKQVKAVLGRYIPQLQELGKQLKAPAQDGSRQLPNAQDRQQLQAVAKQLQATQEQIASELSSVLSPEQLESFKAALKTVGDVNQVQRTDSTGSTDYNYSYGYYAINDLYYAYVYAYYSYLYEGYTTEAYYAYYYAYYAYYYAYYAYYYDTAYAYYAYYYAYYAYYYAYYNYIYYGGTYAYTAYYYAYYGYLNAYYAYYY